MSLSCPVYQDGSQAHTLGAPGLSHPELPEEEKHPEFETPIKYWRLLDNPNPVIIRAVRREHPCLSLILNL